MTVFRPTPLLPEHVAPDTESAVCWIRDVRQYGLAIANAMHPEVSEDVEIVEG